MGMTIDEFDEYAKSHNILTMTKDFYENRLKADMVAMLTDIQLEIEEKKFLESSCYFMDKTEEKNYAVYTDDISNIIQQKIDALKGEQEAADAVFGPKKRERKKKDETAAAEEED